MARLGEIDTTASRALRFTILTASRTSEVLKMTFVEIDFDKAVWTVPASRMKMARQHEVPLSDQAVAILRAQEAERGRNPHVFCRTAATPAAEPHVDGHDFEAARRRRHRARDEVIGAIVDGGHWSAVRTGRGLSGASGRQRRGAGVPEKLDA